MSRKKMRFIPAGIVVFLAAIACHSLQAGADTVPRFAAYDEAVAWYLKQEMETMTPESTAIYMAKYHPQHGILIVYFQKDKEKGYIHGGFSADDWRAFKDAPSKGRHYLYHIRGRFRYYLKNEEPPPQ